MAALATINQLGAVLGDTFGDRAVISIIADGAYIFGPAADLVGLEAAGVLLDSQVDADIQTLDLPPSTTISAFGATLTGAAGPATAQATLGVDPAGTDNSTPVTLAAGSDPALALVGQELDLTLPSLGGTDLSVNYALVNIEIESSSGDNVIIESATPAAAGLMSSTEHVKLASLVYGTEYFAANDDAVLTNSTTTFQSALSLGAVVQGGDYMLTVAYGWNHDIASNDFEARVLQGGAQFKEIHKQEPKDAAGAFGSTGTSQRHYMTRKMPVTLPAGAVLFELEYRTDSAGDSSSIWERTMELLRTS